MAIVQSNLFKKKRKPNKIELALDSCA